MIVISPNLEREVQAFFAYIEKSSVRQDEEEMCTVLQRIAAGCMYSQENSGMRARLGLAQFTTTRAHRQACACCGKSGAER